MTTINLRVYYPWYKQDEFIEVSDEVAAELRADKLYEAAYRRRITRNKAYYSLDRNDGIGDLPCTHILTPEGALMRKERNRFLRYMLSKLSEKQRRRVVAYYADGLTYEKIAEIEGVDKSAVRRSVLCALEYLRKIFKKKPK